MRWIVTFSDLVTLMLVFFVMLFSISSVDTEKFKSFTSPMTKQNINADEVKISKPEEIFNIDQERPSASDDTLDYLYNLLSLRINENEKLHDLKVENMGKFLKLTLTSDIVFESNSVELRKEGQKLFTDVLLQLVNLKNQISFIAYSDPRPIVSRGYDTNEKLSLARAMAVLKLMKKMGYSGEPTILLGGTKLFDKLDPAIPLEERYVLSRKVDIIIYASYLNQQELYLLPNV